MFFNGLSLLKNTTSVWNAAAHPPQQIWPATHLLRLHITTSNHTHEIWLWISFIKPHTWGQQQPNCSQVSARYYTSTDTQGGVPDSEMCLINIRRRVSLLSCRMPKHHSFKSSYRKSTITCSVYNNVDDGEFSCSLTGKALCKQIYLCKQILVLGCPTWLFQKCLYQQN